MILLLFFFFAGKLGDIALGYEKLGEYYVSLIISDWIWSYF